MTPVTLRRALSTIIALTVIVLSASPAAGQEPQEITISGQIAHGLVDPDFDPTKLAVTLNVLEGVTTLDQVSARASADGSFAFTVANAENRVYFLGVEYQGARYSEVLDSSALEEPVVIQVFDATHDTSVLQIVNYVVIVTGAVAEEGWVEVEERVRLLNESGTTLIPDLSETGMLSFLRFGLPLGAYNLGLMRADSTLVGGQIVTVDRGFAFTSPIPPTDGTPHRLRFVYRLDYEEETLDLSRTLRFGADSFAFIAAVDTGRPRSPRLEDLGVAEIESGPLVRLLEAQGIEPGEFLPLSISGLPLPSLWSRVRGSAGSWYVTWIVPGALIAGSALLLAYAMRRRRFAIDLRPQADIEAQRRTLLEQAAALEEQRRAGAVSDRRYESERAEIKQALVDLRLQSHGNSLE